MWHFEHSRTDSKGKFFFEGLRARGWDMSAWEAGQVGNGTYSVHVEGPDYAVEARGIALAAGANARQDLTALAARRMTSHAGRNRERQAGSQHPHPGVLSGRKTRRDDRQKRSRHLRNTARARDAIRHRRASGVLREWQSEQFSARECQLSRPKQIRTKLTRSS